MKKPVTLFLSVVLLIVMLLTLSGFMLPHFLAFKKSLETKNILIEAWISAYEIEQAVKDYGHDPGTRFYVVGMEYPDSDGGSKSSEQKIKSDEFIDTNGLWLYTNSTVIIKPKEALLFRTGDTLQIKVNLKGQQAAGNFAVFSVIVNGQYLGGNFTSENYRDYCYQYILPREDINSVAIRFENDLLTDMEDRNLNIKSVKINESQIFPGAGMIILTKDLNKLATGFSSQAEEIVAYLGLLGIDHDRIFPVKYNPARRNKTLDAAMEFKRFIATNQMDKINIVSSGIHSRRTWFTYNKVLGGTVKAGIIYYPDSLGKPLTGMWSLDYYLTIFNEFFSFLGNWIALNLRPI